MRFDHQSVFARRLTVGCAVLYAVLLTYALVVPAPLSVIGEQGEVAEQTVDRSVSGFLQHVMAYAIFAVLALAAGRGRRWWPVAIVLVTVHSIATECLQALVPSRYSDLHDLIGNSVGIAAGFCVFLAGSRFLRGNRVPPSATVERPKDR